MAIEVRNARTGDERLVAALIQELAAESCEQSPISEPFVAAYLDSLGSYLLLAEQRGEVVGLVSYSVRPDLYHAAPSALIETLIVRRDRRSQGVGGALLAELMRRLISLGCAEVAVTTMPDNHRALRFYRSHGFVDEALFLERHF